MDWKSLAGGAAVFLGLQLVSFVVAILANGSTPMATRMGQLVKSTWADQRKEAALDRLARLILVDQHPQRYIARLIIMASLSIILFVMPGSFFALLSAEEKVQQVILFGIEPIPSDDRAIIHATLFGFCLLASMLAMNLTVGFGDYLVHPKRTARKALKLLERRGMAEDVAWKVAIDRAAKRTFSVPRAT